VKPGLIILDTMARTFGGGDENSASDMGAFVRNADLLKEELGTAILVVHHPGRNVKRGPRGSTALYGVLDTMMLMEKKGKPERLADGTTVIHSVLSCQDQKDAPCFDPHILTLTCRDSCVAVEAEQVKGKAPKPKALDNRTKLLAALKGDCTEFHTWMRLSGVPQSSFYKTRDKLVEEGAVLQVGSAIERPRQILSEKMTRILGQRNPVFAPFSHFLTPPPLKGRGVRKAAGGPYEMPSVQLRVMVGGARFW
jgi:hypothetical protein